MAALVQYFSEMSCSKLVNNQSTVIQIPKIKILYPTKQFDILITIPIFPVYEELRVPSTVVKSRKREIFIYMQSSIRICRILHFMCTVFNDYVYRLY